MELDILDNNYIKNKNIFSNNSVLILAAGFEERGLAFLRKFSDIILNKCHVIILDYPNINYHWRDEIISIIKSRKFTYDTIKFGEYDRLYKLLLEKIPNEIYIDISSIGRYNIFKALYSIEKTNIKYHIIYTEANEYYPLKEFYEKITSKAKTKERAFDFYLDNEKSELVYSYECSLFEDDEFIGNLEPGLPILLITFFGFKRSRLQIVLQSLEVDKKIFILSEPTREDIKWRKDLQKIINFDLYQKNRDYVKCLKTSNPLDTFRFLQNKINKDLVYFTHNVKLVPLGSKLQTVACFYFWNNIKDISILFSLPKEYYADKYSIGYKNTFIMSNEYINQNFKLRWKKLEQISV